MVELSMHLRPADPGIGKRLVYRAKNTLRLPAEREGKGTCRQAVWYADGTIRFQEKIKSGLDHLDMQVRLRERIGAKHP